MDIAVIGAGISGLSIANSLQELGLKISVFEKARGVGGRMSTRYFDPYFIDHGAQHFNARSKQFKKFLQPYIEQEIIREWDGKVVTIEADKKPEKSLWFEKQYVPYPYMNSLCKKLSETIDLHLNIEIKTIYKQQNKWNLTAKNGDNLGSFDWVISTAPPIQSNNLLPAEFIHHDNVKAIEVYPCFSLMLGFDKDLKSNWVGARFRDSTLSWAAIDSKKRGLNPDLTSIIIHTESEWSDLNKDRDKQDIQNEMIIEFKKLTGIDGDDAKYVAIHRWLYARAKEKSEEIAFIDVDNKLAACGDWCLHSNIENAYLSGQEVVKRIREEL